MSSLPAWLPKSIPEAIAYYRDVKSQECSAETLKQIERKLILGDLFYLLAYACRRRDMLHPWLFDRCREVQKEPDGHLDLWSRGHYKNLANDTPILTANRGWVNHGELVVGDTVYAPDKTPVAVLALSERYVDSECMEITFDWNYRDSIIAGAYHEWLVDDKIIQTRALHIGMNIGGHLITGMQMINSVPTRCIQVDGGMYCAGRQMVPTRNSTIITFGKTIQDVLADPEITVNIFSHVRPIAKSFLAQIKNELQINDKLKYLFDDVLYEDPERDAQTWSLDSGLIVKRKSNPKEPTINASGLVDGQPTAMHFKLRVYDDVVTPASVTSVEMMQKTLDALDMSDNLGTSGGKVRMIGTRYRLGDAYEDYEKRGIVKVRKYPATDDGTVNGNPVFLTVEEWEDKLSKQSAAIISSQMLQNPQSSESTIFQPEWFRLYPAMCEAVENGRTISVANELPPFDMVFQSIDGAFSEKTSADYSVILTLGLFKATEGSSKYSALILDCFMEKIDYPKLRDEAIRQWGNKYGKNDKSVDGIIIEDKASGHALIPDLRRADITVYPYSPGALDKTARANLVSHLVRDGYLWIPESRNPKRKGYCMSWLAAWKEQMDYFPNVKNDDGVDSVVQALSVLDKMGFLRGRVAPPRETSYWKKLMRGSYSGDAVNNIRNSTL